MFILFAYIGTDYISGTVGRIVLPSLPLISKLVQGSYVLVTFWNKTRLISIESQPEKVVVVVVIFVVVVGLVAISLVIGVVVVVVVIVGHRNLTLKYGQNWACSCCG